MTPDARAALEELVEELGSVLDNADGYDKSTFRATLLTLRAKGDEYMCAWSIEELLQVEERARGAYKRAAAALREPVGEPQLLPDTFVERVARIAQSASQGYDVPVILTAIEAAFVRRATTGGRHE